jgi:hypothetical protein
MMSAESVNPSDFIRFPYPERFGEAPVSALLRAAALGRIGVDQRLIRSILDRGESAIPDLMAFALDDHENDPVPLDLDLVAMFRYLRTPEALPFYVKLMREMPDECPDEMTEAIVALGPAAIDPLLKLYEELGEEQGSEPAFVLASLGVRDSRILGVLLEQLEYNASEGAFLLSVYGDPAAKPALDRILQQISEEDKEFRFEIERAIAALREDSPSPELDAFDIWELYPEKSLPEMELVTQEERLALLASPSAEYRAEAAASFRQIDLPDKIRDRLLEAATTDPDATVRGHAWEALEDVEDPRVMRAMRSAAANSAAPYEERGGALIGLAAYSDEPEIRKQILALYEAVEGRALAMRAMWRSLDRTFGGYFVRHLDDSDPEIRRQAVWGVGHLNLFAQAGRLQALFADDDYRADALYNYALCSPGGISRGRAKGLLRKIDELAEGLSDGETVLVKAAIDQRLKLHGMDSFFEQAEEEEEPAAAEAPPAKIGRNDPCPCGSGKKYKKCHGQ